MHIGCALVEGIDPATDSLNQGMVACSPKAPRPRGKELGAVDPTSYPLVECSPSLHKALAFIPSTV